MYRTRATTVTTGLEQTVLKCPMPRSVVVLVIVALVAGTSEATTPTQKCAAGKARASGKALTGLLKCAAAACKKGTAVDAGCEAKATDKLTGAFAKIEAKGGCAGTDDAPTTLAHLDSLSRSLRGDLAVGGPSKCTAAKYRTAAKFGGLLTKCRKTAVQNGQSLDAACLSEAVAKFACTDAEGRGDCLVPGGDCPLIASKVGAFVTCGDGHVDAGEQCDDGNLASGDGCDTRCQTEKHVEAAVAAGGTVTTDAGSGATPADPAQAAVTSPVDGTISITVRTADPAPTGFRALDRQFDIVAPAGTPEAPLLLTFTIDISLVPAGEDEQTIVVFRDDLPVPACPGDPCVATRARVGDDIVLTVSTTEASAWRFEAWQPNCALLRILPPSERVICAERGSNCGVWNWACGDVDCGTCGPTRICQSSRFCVANPSCYADTGDGTIRDSCTGLQWEKKDTAVGSGLNAADLHDVDNVYTWAGCCNGDCSTLANYCQPNVAAASTCAAQSGGMTGCSVCASGTCNVDPHGSGASTTVWDWINMLNAANFSGHNDWRLPSESGCNICASGGACCSPVHELESILLSPYLCGASPCISSIFGPTVASYYWPASAYLRNPGIAFAWYVNFGVGYVFSTDQSSGHSVRAVRAMSGNTTTTTPTTSTTSSSSSSSSSTTATTSSSTISSTTSAPSTTSTTTTTLPCGTFLLTFGWGVTDGANAFEVCTSNCRQGIAGSTGDGEFYQPMDVEADGNGNVFVVDIGDSFIGNVQKFTNSGAFITKWGGGGAADGHFGGAVGVTVAGDGTVYVADAGNHRVQRFTGGGTFLQKWGSFGAADGQFSGPYGIDVDSNGNVFVVEISGNRVQKFTSTGGFITKWGGGGSGLGQFAGPWKLAVDLSGNVFVADTNNARIQKFDNNGNFLTAWSVAAAHAVAVDHNGNVFVSGGDQVHKFNNNGTPISDWGSHGSGDGQFINSFGIDVDAGGNVFVVDRENHRIQKFACQ